MICIIKERTREDRGFQRVMLLSSLVLSLTIKSIN